MRRFNARILSTASLAVLAIAGLPTVASAQDTQNQGPACETLPEGAERDQCVADRTDTPPPSVSGDAATLGPQAGQQQESGAIVVTGSRIRRSEFNSPDPITIINPELQREQGQIETAEFINSSPIAAGSVQITGAISNNFVTEGGQDAQTVSLRGLGANRTLVLLNGRRAGPAGIRGQVTSFDLNVLPSSIVRSIEILKTGASSIYGSDAIAGVVNILTRRETDGIEVQGFVSLPEEGGAETYNLSATYGRDFGRGHFLVTADYFRRQDLQRNDRRYLNCTEEFLTFVDGRRADIVDPRTGRPACSGVLNNAVLTNNDFTQLVFDENGDIVDLAPGLIGPNGQQLFVSQFAVGNELNGVCDPITGQQPGVVAPANFFGCNFDGPSTGALNNYSPLEQASDVLSDVERYTIFASGSYEITDSIELFGEFLYNKRRTRSDGVQQFDVFLFTGSSGIPGFPGLPQLGLCDPTADFNCRTTDAGDPFNTEFSGNFLLRPLILTEFDSSTDIDYYRGVLGARGEFGDALSGWFWDLHGQYSRSDADYTSTVIFDDSLYTQSFRTRSCAGLVTPVRGVPCIDIDFMDPRFLRGEFTQQERDFLFGEETGRTVFEQLGGELSFSGNLFTLPAGDVGVAFGGVFRRDEINDVPGEQTLAGNSYNRTSSGITAGRTTTKEVFGEIQIPLVHNTNLIERLTLTAAGRYTDVSARRRDGVSDSFSDSTWKVGLDWQVNNWLRFRGSYGTSFRAPALFELFLENQTGFLAQQDIDICINTAVRLAQGSISQRIFDNCAAAGIPPNFQGATGGATIVQGGGIGNLEPETSTALVLSAVFTPEPGPWSGARFSLVIDYFDIQVDDEITTLGASNIIRGCYASEFFPDEPLCDQVTRAVGGPENLNITEVRDTYLNINKQNNRGIDVTARYVQDMGSWGNLTVQAQMTWQLDDVLELFEGTPLDLNGEAGDPVWVGDFNVNWTRRDWSVNYGLDVIGGTDNREDLIVQQNSLCRTSLFRPGVDAAAAAAGQRVLFCQDVRLAPRFYHSASVTHRFGGNERFAITLGVANLFNTAPPRASTALVPSGLSAIGQVPVFGSQYDLVGRRFFASARARF